MWYLGYQEPLDLSSTPISIGLATSDDGITWTRHESGPDAASGLSLGRIGLYRSTVPQN